MSVHIGNAYDFSDIGSDNSVLWVCLSRRSTNDQILKLAAAMSKQPLGPAVEIRSESGEKAWLIPAISVAVHQLDIESRAIASRFELVPAELDIELIMAIGNFPDELVDSLQNSAWSISDYFQANPDRQVVPDIEDCLLLNEESSSGSLTFAWRHDKNRRYSFRTSNGNKADLRQKYDPGDGAPWPADAPLKVGPATIMFADDGSTVEELKDSDIKAIRSAFGLTAEREVHEAVASDRAGLSEFLYSILGGWKAAAAVAALAVIAVTVILLPTTQVPTFEVHQAYATTDVRGVEGAQLGIMLKLQATDVSATTAYFERVLRDAGVTVTVDQMPGEVELVTGSGRIEASAKLRDILASQDIDLSDREFIEIEIQPVD
jgi:hypothetical protein